MLNAKDRVLNEAKGLNARYHRLLIAVEKPESEIRTKWDEIAALLGATELNVNLILSEKLLPHAREERPRIAAKCFAQAIVDNDCSSIILRHIGILFDPALRLSPLRLLKAQSRHRNLIVVWGGDWDGRRLTYAYPGHPEYIQEDGAEISVVELESN